MSAEHTGITDSTIDRRTILAAAGAVGAAGVLAACGSSADTPGVPTSSMASTEVPAQESAITTTQSVPVGGGVVVEDKMVVVTQPAEGEFKAFTSVCPHQGCTVSDVTADEIICPCHGSRFSASTGEVIQGPATTGLAPVQIQVKGDQVTSVV